MILSMEEFKRGRGHPGIKAGETREQIAERLAHPLFKRWQLMRRREGAMADVWRDDFWEFTASIGVQPEGTIKLRRLDQFKPMGPGNWEWAKTPSAEEVRGYMRTYYREKGHLSKDKLFQRKYGISLSDYEEMHAAQDGRCAICSKFEKVRHRIAKGDVRNLCVDHDHDTGESRALLCGDCNRGLGMFCDDPDLLLKAAAYLQKHKSARAA